MGKRAPATRRYLQSLSNQITHLQTSPAQSYALNGTGVRGASKEMAAWFARRDRLRDLHAQRRLVEAGLVEILDTGERAEARLTKDGYVTVLKDRICSQESRRDDGLFCLVSFDIPEDVRTTRIAFRRFLKQAGFAQVQLSVWQSEKDVSDDIKKLVHELGLEKWVKVFLVAT